MTPRLLRRAGQGVALAAALLLSAPTHAAVLLPNGEQTFVDANGVPLAGGTVEFDIPSTSTKKTTWRDPGQSIINANPVVLDSAGRAIIYGSGQYRQIVKDVNGVLQWDQLTSDGAAGGVCSYVGTSGGTPNAQTVTGPNFSTTSGSCFTFLAGLTNSGAMTIAVSGGSPLQVLKDTASGPVPLTGGEVASGNIVTVTYESISGSLHMQSFPQSLSPNFITVTTQNLIVTNTLTFSGAITPAALASNTNDWNPTGLSTTYTIRASSSADVNLTGLQALPAGRIIQLINIGTHNITLTPLDASSLAANQFAMNSRQQIGPGSGVILWYDILSTAWRPIDTIQQQASLGRAAFAALKVQVTSDTSATASADELVLEDPNGNTKQVSAVSVSPSLSSTGANGLDTGSATANTWYAVWVIYNNTTNTVAGLFSASASAPTMPAGYTFKTRVGWVRYDSGPKLWRTIQYGRDVQVIIGTNPATSPVLANASGSINLANFVPPTASRVAGVITGNSTGDQIAPNSSYDNNNLGTKPPPVIFNLAGGVSGDQMWEFVIEGTSAITTTLGGTSKVTLLGWTDNL